MREFSTQISDALNNGLRPNLVRNEGGFFLDLYNFVPYELALRPYEDVRDITGKQFRGFLFPQWFDLEEGDILIMPDRVLGLDKSYFPYDVTGVKHGFPSIFTEQIKLVDYGDNWIAADRNGCVYSYGGKFYANKNLRVASLLAHNNRTVFGGPLNGFWTPAWLESFKKFSFKAGIDINHISKRSIIWSSFDSVDLPFGLFHFDTIPVSIKELFMSNQLGFMQMKYSGDVVDMISSAGQLFVFQTNGITSLVDSPELPGGGFSETGSQPIGIKKRGAVGGDQYSFVFIDNRNQLWKVSQNGLTKLDYKEYMSQLHGDIFITKDPDEELFYIGDDKVSYVLNGNALTRVKDTVQRVRLNELGRIGQVFPTGNNKAIFQTEELNLGQSNLRTLTGVAIITNRPEEGFVTVEALVNDKKVVRPPVRLNKQGYAACRLYGTNHKVRVEFKNYEDLTIDRIELKWQIDDNRTTRGTFVTENATGTGE